MHHRVVVVSNVILGGKLSEVATVTWFYIIQIDFYVLVSVTPVLFVIEPKGVSNLV